MAHTANINIGNDNANTGNIINSFNISKSDEDIQILRWLSPLETNNRHEGVRAERLAGVGDWLLETPEFRVWIGEGGVDKAVLFCSGNPGVGKTYISSLVIDSLCDQAGKKNIVVAGLYCDFLAQQEQTITNMMGAILKQLVGRGEIPHFLREAFQKGKSEIGGRKLLLPDLLKMLRTAIASLPQVFICIDALDEFLPKDLPELLKVLGNIIRESPTTRIFLTGRPHIREDIQRHFRKAVVIPISPNTDDIRSYLEMRLDRDTDPEAMTDGLRADIIQVVLEKISDIFLLVSLNMDAVLGEVTIRKRRKKLEAMAKGNGLSDAYTATLTRLKAQKGDKSILGQRVLMWVRYSERPLQAKELCHALGVEVGSTDLDVENIPALRTLLTSCLGLVIVEATSSTVRLVHYTLQEHLSSDETLFHCHHSIMSEVCLTYLNFESVRDTPPILRSAPTTMPLLDYASRYWGEHTRKGMTENGKALALRLLERFHEHISAQLMLLGGNTYRGSQPWFYGLEGPVGFTGLHGAAFVGIVEIVAAILKIKEWDVNVTDSTGSTALMWATVRGHEEVVKVLLNQHDVNPDQPDTEYGRMPLSWAAKIGHEGIVKMLLERDVNPDPRDTFYRRTPLWWAAKNGHEGIVKMLLERDVNPDHPDTLNCWTPLSWAARNGHEGIVKMLLERDVNPDQPDTEDGQTPLSWAARNGEEGTVKILLEQGVNPDQPDTFFGRTPLLWATENGHEGIVKMLLERDVNPDQPDTEYSRTPLWWAARNGHEGIVKMLLERDANPDHPHTEYGRAPLWWAARNEHEGIVKMLLERDVNPDQPDTKYGRTPLSWAARNGNHGIVNMLLERDVNPDQPDTEDGLTPLSWAARNGKEGIVKILLEQDVNPDQPDTYYGRTPLLWAAGNGCEGVVKILLERDDVNPNLADTIYGRTPLSWAAQNGYEGIVKTLLERKDVHTATPDRVNETPLSRARARRHDRIVTMLHERDSVNSHRADLTARHISPPPLSMEASEADIPFGDPYPLEPISDLTDSSPQPVDRDPPVAEEPLRDADTSSNDPRSIPPSPQPLVRYITIACFVCLFAFLVYILPSSLPEIFRLHKLLPSDVNGL